MNGSTSSDRSEKKVCLCRSRPGDSSRASFDFKSANGASDRSLDHHKYYNRQDQHAHTMSYITNSDLRSRQPRLAPGPPREQQCSRATSSILIRLSLTVRAHDTVTRLSWLQAVHMTDKRERGRRTDDPALTGKVGPAGPRLEWLGPAEPAPSSDPCDFPFSLG